MYRIRTPKWSRAIYPAAIWTRPSADPGTPVVHLTFDDGPVAGVTDEILDILKAEGIQATFFCIGRQVEAQADLYARIQAEGHAVGNHSYSHKSGLTMSTSDYLKDIAQCAKTVNSRLFRPPYGRLRPSQYLQLKKEKDIVMYDVLSGDFDRSVSAEQCAINVLENAENGSIILMHDNLKIGWKTVEYLPSIIKGLREKGFSFSRI